MATQFANGINPWTSAMPPKTHQSGKPVKKQPQATGSRIDPSQLEIASDPLPTTRLVTNKYWPLFSRLKVGQNIRCKPGDAQSVAQALRKYIELNKVSFKGRPARVITQGNAPDGIGRVWLVEAEAKAQQKKAA